MPRVTDERKRKRYRESDVGADVGIGMRITDKQNRWLTKEAKARKMSRSALIRYAIDVFMNGGVG